MRRALIALAFLAACAASARAETPRSPYRISWQLPGEPLSAIEVDRGDLSVSRFGSAYELVRFLRTLKPEPKAAPTRGEAPWREILVEQLASDGKTRTSERYAAAVEAWRRRVGEPMVERLEDEFDAHLRMIFPRKVTPPDGGAR